MSGKNVYDKEGLCRYTMQELYATLFRRQDRFT
jgi:hypothetical protein